MLIKILKGIVILLYSYLKMYFSYFTVGMYYINLHYFTIIDLFYQKFQQAITQ